MEKRDTVKEVADLFQSFNDCYDLILKNRKKEVVRPRQIAMYLMRHELQFSYPGIGEKLGGRDHTTAIHAFEKISKNLLDDEKLSEEINQIREQIYKID